MWWAINQSHSPKLELSSYTKVLKIYQKTMVVGDETSVMRQFVQQSGALMKNEP